jgi:hypothetical protein
MHDKHDCDFFFIAVREWAFFWFFREIVCKLPSKQRIVGCLEVKVYDGEVGLLR